MRDYEFYVTMQPIQLHFISSYDYFKYNGKVKPIAYDQIIRKREYPLIQKFAAKVPFQQGKDFFVAQYASDNDKFLFNGIDKAWTTYVEWEKKQNSLSEYVRTDLQFILSNNIILKTIRDGTLLQWVAQNKVQKETVIILDAVFAKFLDGWKTKYANDPYLIKIVDRLIKYRPFVEFNRDKISTIIGEEISVKQY